MVSYEELVLPNDIIEMQKKYDECNKLVNTREDHCKNVVDSIIMIVETFLSFGEDNCFKKRLYLNYADFLAKYEYYDDAIYYYDLAFIHKFMKEDEFFYPFRKKYFDNNLFLYNRKCTDYFEKSTKQFSSDEMKIRMKIKEMIASDQIVRKYIRTFPSEISCSDNLLIFVDSINMIKIIDLLTEFPEIDDPLYLEKWDYFVLGRHLFTAYPNFWLTYFEPIARKQLLNGCYVFGAQSYARTYDRCMIISGKSQYSFYGEWDNDGKNVNPDSLAVAKRRINLGLPLLKDKPTDEIFFITY